MASRSGYGALLAVGSYTGAEIEDISVEINHEPVDVTDLGDTWRKRQAGLQDWTITGRKKYADNEWMTLAASARTSVACKVTDPRASNVFSCVGFITRGVTNYPMGAAGEEITVVGGGATPSKP